MKAKKSLGQNFLKSKAVANDLVRASNITEEDIVIEVGPGKGMLTTELLKKAGVVIAVEKDDSLIPYLKERFKSEIKNKKLILEHGDILNFDTKKYNLKNNSYKIAANIPYYITGEILRLFLENKNKPSSITLLVQKEVAERIIERDRKGSILSNSVKIFGIPKYIKKVPAKLFNPVPKVDSAIITIEGIKSPFKNVTESEFFFKILKSGFAHKRKFLSANLKKHFSKEITDKAFKVCGLDEKIRAEKLSIENWKCLVDNLK